MSSRTLINLGLLLTIIIVVLILYFSEDKTQQDNTIYLSNIDKETINHIDLISSIAEPMEFKKIDTQWHITKPLMISANPDRIKALLGLLSLPSATKLAVDEVKLENLELDPAKAFLTFNQHEFKFGGTDAISEYRYVLFDQNIYLIEDRLYPQLNSGLHFFIDNRLAPYNNIQSIKFNDNEYLADSNPALIQYWQTARAASITPYSGKETNGNITISLANGDTIEYKIIADEERLRLTRPEKDVEYHLLSTQKTELLKQNTDEDEAK